MEAQGELPHTGTNKTFLSNNSICIKDYQNRNVQRILDTTLIQFLYKNSAFVPVCAIKWKSLCYDCRLLPSIWMNIKKIKKNTKKIQFVL